MLIWTDDVSRADSLQLDPGGVCEVPRGQVVRDAKRLVITEISDFRTTPKHSPCFSVDVEVNVLSTLPSRAAKWAHVSTSRLPPTSRICSQKVSSRRVWHEQPTVVLVVRVYVHREKIYGVTLVLTCFRHSGERPSFQQFSRRSLRPQVVRDRRSR